MPMSSVTTANIGTPRTNAANMRCTSAAIQTAPRAPTPGKRPYAPAVSAAACRSANNEGSVIAGEERKALGEVDWHGTSHFAQELDGDFLEPALARVVFHALDYHPAHERRYAVDTGGSGGRPPHRGRLRHPVADVAERPEGLRRPIGFVRAGGIGGEDVLIQCERPGATSAAQRAILAPPALSSQHPGAQLSKERSLAPDLGE